MKQKQLTPQQLRAYMDRDRVPLTTNIIAEMEQRGFKIPDALKEQCK